MEMALAGCKFPQTLKFTGGGRVVADEVPVRVPRLCEPD